MAKKERNQVSTVILDQSQQIPDEEVLLEAEAYGSPQPDAGSDVTVLKPVGMGGPVPIVAPKHNTIQLQPIIVPLAVVPYMTQDSGVLRTDGRPAGGSVAPEYDEATEFKSVQKEKKSVAKRQKVFARVFCLISFIVAVVLCLPYILSYFNVKIGGLSLAEFNVIGLMKGWINKSVPFSFSPAANIINLAAMAIFMLTALILFIGLLAGRYPRAFTGIFSLIGSGCVIAVLVIDVVKKAFVAKDRIALIVLLALSVVAFALSIAFAAILNRMEDKEDYSDSEI